MRNGSSRKGRGIGEAAALLWQHWRHCTRIRELPASCRPGGRADGYAIQAEVARISGQHAGGWKIAATSVAGQRHIGVNGPLAGRLFIERMLPPGAAIPLRGNVLRVAEPEFAFRLGAALPPAPSPYTLDEVLAAAVSIHPAIEIPDSRYDDFAAVGAAQLIADTACASWVTIGPPASFDWRNADLAAHPVRAFRNGTLAAEGRGENVMGDPRAALAWLANELGAHGEGLRAGDIVITGTCAVPVPIAAGDSIRMDFGPMGAVEASLVG